MRFKHRLIVALTLATTTIAAAFSQSAYSKYGYGFLRDNSTDIQRAMGGVGYATQNGRIVNVMNPASYANVDSLTFLWDVGIDFTNLFAKEDGKSGYSFGGGLDYIAAEFRVANNLGASFGIMPYSSIGYSFGNDIDDGSEMRVGSGGLNQLYLGFGYEPIKRLSIGVNASYVFGTTNNATYVYSSSTSVFNRVMEVRDWNATVGLQYRLPLSPRDVMVFGLTYAPRKPFHGHVWGTYYDALQDSRQDSIGYSPLKDRNEMPNTIGAGVSITHNAKFNAEFNFTYQDWSKAKYEPLEGFESLNSKPFNRWKTALGLQYTPNRRGSYFGAMMFRAGAYYNHDYINILGNNVRDYGVSCGVGLPCPGSKTTINLGLEWIHRYSSPAILVKEDYFNITLSINFNEMWFWKRRIR